MWTAWYGCRRRASRDIARIARHRMRCYARLGQVIARHRTHAPPFKGACACDASEGGPGSADEGGMSERCCCPECTARAAVLLLESGRASMALSLLRGLPEAIREAVAEARAEGVRDGRRTRPTKPPSKPTAGTASRPAATRPAFQRGAAELAIHVERLGAARVAEVLRVDAADLIPLLQGRVGVAKSALERLRKTG